MILFLQSNLPSFAEVITQTFTNLINGFSEFIPKLIQTIIVLALGYFIVKFVGIVLKKALEKIGIDKIGDKLNEIDFFKKLKTEIKISAILTSVVSIFIWLIFLISAANILGVPAISNIVLMLVEFIPKVIAAGLMLMAGLFLSDKLKQVVTNMCLSFGIQSGKLIGSVVFMFFFVITVIAALGQAGINTKLLESSFNIIIAGVIFAFAFGYGLASKDILSNMLSGMYSRGKFKEGQVIEIDGIKGSIYQIDNTNIVIKTENAKVVMPMVDLQTKKITIFD